jgi:hypothetical protein
LPNALDFLTAGSSTLLLGTGLEVTFGARKCDTSDTTTRKHIYQQSTPESQRSVVDKLATLMNKRNKEATSGLERVPRTGSSEQAWEVNRRNLGILMERLQNQLVERARYDSVTDQGRAGSARGGTSSRKCRRRLRLGSPKKWSRSN